MDRSRSGNKAAEWVQSQETGQETNIQETRYTQHRSMVQPGGKARGRAGSKHPTPKLREELRRQG